MRRALMILSVAIAAAACQLSSLQAEEGKYNYDPKMRVAVSDSILGIGSLELGDDGATITQSKVNTVDLRDAKGAKKSKIALKPGDEFQLTYDSGERTSMRLDKVEGEYAFFSVHRKFLKKTAFAEKGSEQIYPCKMKAFSKP